MGSKNGTLDAPFDIVAITKHLAGMRAEMTVSDVRGLKDTARAVAPDGVSSWSAPPTADELVDYAWVVDDNGLVDATDGSTYRMAVVW